MLDGLLLFSVLDVWRVLLPLGLALICLGTFLFQRMLGELQDTGLSPFLCILTYRLTVTFAFILAVVGILVPLLLGYTLPERHLADGPWSYEEIFGYLVALALLWRIQRQVRQQQIPSWIIMGCVTALFFCVALLWIGRLGCHGECGSGARWMVCWKSGAMGVVSNDSKEFPSSFLDLGCGRDGRSLLGNLWNA